MLRHFKTLTWGVGLIVLILLASVPEVRCCCDVSWGPAGLLGNSTLCCASSNPQPHADCCCCSHEQEEGAPPADGCSGEDCNGCLTVIYPAPMVAGPNMESVAAPFAGAWSEASSAKIVAPPLAALDLVETPDSVLMPAQRCALFQTWLV